jgi:hypothetical protein
MSPIASLKTALRDLLAGDATLSALLGGPRIYDDVPRGEATPYVVFGDATARENGTSSDRGHVCEVTLLAWSRHGGAKEALAIADRIAALTDDAALTLTGHRLILMRVAATDVRRQIDKDLTRVNVRIRAITEQV